MPNANYPKISFSFVTKAIGFVNVCTILVVRTDWFQKHRIDWHFSTTENCHVNDITKTVATHLSRTAYVGIYQTIEWSCRGDAPLGWFRLSFPLETNNSLPSVIGLKLLLQHIFSLIFDRFPFSCSRLIHIPCILELWLCKYCKHTKVRVRQATPTWYKSWINILRETV